ncbi:MAG: energy-coupling factor transporter transmembrane component T [Solirubrobacteraceae bacterium]
MGAIGAAHVTRSLAYRRLASPLHATRASIGALWSAAFVLVALIISNPVLLCALARALARAGGGAARAARMRRALVAVAVVAAPIVFVNVLVSRQGLTVFARLGSLGPFGEGDLTVEALVAGAVIALKVGIIILTTTLASLAVDPDQLLASARRLSFRSALTASLALRMVPLLAADAQRFAEAQRTRPAARSGLRARALVLGAVVSGALDRAMDVAATLEVRGLAAVHGAARPARAPRALSRHDVAFLVSAAALLALVATARVLRLDSFRAYPLIHLSLSAGTGALCAALIAAGAAPFLDRRGIAP